VVVHNEKVDNGFQKSGNMGIVLKLDQY